MKLQVEIKLAYHQDTDSKPAEVGICLERINNPGPEGDSSLNAQRQANLEMATAAGVVIPQEYKISEVGSGIDPNRPGARRVWDLVMRDEVRHVFLNRADRWSRETRELLNFIDHCAENNVKIHCADGAI